MTKKPFFSIVIPTYNRAKDLEFALFCLSRQSFSDYEIIISDNCSTDKTEELIKNKNDKRIRYFKLNKNEVFSLNLANGIKHAKGKYIFFHSDDDFLLSKNSLEKIYEECFRKNIGYARVCYMCLTPERNSLFFFKPNKRFLKNEYLEPLSENQKVLSFITDSDHYFITGLIYRNNLPKNVTMVKAEHAPWMDLLFTAAKKYGACFIANPYVIASWSVWRNSSDGTHPVYSLLEGRLESENYFNIIKEKLSRKEYKNFLHNQLISIYVRLFPLIKVKIGNNNLRIFTKRILQIDSEMKNTLRFWIYFSIAIILPAKILKKMRDIYLTIYINTSKVSNNQKIILELQQLEKEYKKTFKIKENRFNFK